MTELTASRTLVKSPPELWAACSDPSTLGRHLEPFGKITITRLEPESTVAWEGERASGTVRIEPSGWGTKVTLTAAEKAVEAARVRRGGLLGRLVALFGAPESASPAVAASKAAITTPLPAGPAPDARATLAAALERLGQAHRRPFSRG